VRIKFTLVLILAFGAGSVFAHRDAALAEPGLRFVDLNRCMEETPAILQEFAKLTEFHTPILKGLQEKGKQLNSLAGELSILDPQSQEYLTRSFQLDTERLALERQQQFQVKQYQNRKAEVFLRTTRLIHEAAAELGKQKGYAGIMVQPFQLQDLPADIPTAADALQGRRLLWTHPEYDITQEVIDSLVDNP
jgi:Skp family chaperone for outer membrane proteins